MAIKDGGPVFPNYERCVALPMGTQEIKPIGGMTLRDYFAAKAMAALLTQMTYGNQGQHCAMYDPNDRQQAISLAHLSYMAADAMLNAREGCVTAKGPLLEDDFGVVAGDGR